MTYLPWAVFVEGNSDFAYLEVLIPRVLDDIIAVSGTRPVTVSETPALRLGRDGRSIEDVSKEICATHEAYHVLFVHGDTGGRAQQEALANRTIAYVDAAHRLCAFQHERCVYVTPRHEIEAWALSDPAAVLDALGYNGRAQDLALPLNGVEAERLPDPKAVLRDAVAQVRGRRRRGRTEIPLPAIAQRQSLAALMAAPSFSQFHQSLRGALAGIGLLRQ